MNYLEKAVRTGDWLVNNQYISHPDWQPQPFEDFDMNEDMNFGRYVRNYIISKQKITHLSTNWLTGMSIYGLLMLHDLTDEDKYVKSSINASFYLKALQNVMDSNPAYCGPFSERITANLWCAPRDAISAAWGLLRLFNITGDPELLNRCELFADWHIRNSMPNGYPIGYYFFCDQPNKTFLANCQGGSSLFYYDLYKKTGKSIYFETMQKIMDFYIEKFVNNDGSINIFFNQDTGEAEDDSSAWSDMHKYNDDFGALALLATYEATSNKEYLDSALNYMSWVVDKQKDDGSFGTYSLAVSSCVVALNCMNIFFITNDKKFLTAGMRALEHMENSVVIDPENLKIHGALLGMDVADISEKPDNISLRITMYAIYTYIAFHIYNRYIKAEKKDLIPESLCKNPMFIGLKISQK